MLHSNDSLWPLVKKLLGVPMFKRMYIAHIRTIINENFANNAYYTTGQYLQSIIDTAVQSDVHKFYTYSQFLSNLTTNVTSGTQTTVGITYLMEARTNYLQGSIELQQIPPTINNIACSDTAPAMNSSFYITASVSNTSAVFLGKRYGITERFFREPMFDDGMHGDGAPGDGVYGVSVQMNAALLHYFIYAENNNAGMFSPERAEHEYYTLLAGTPLLLSGSVVINEFMAINNLTVSDAGGNYDDWIELYNNSASDACFNNLFISDSYTTPLKWCFPDGLNLPAGGYLIVWADNHTTEAGLHSCFGLSGSGEKVIISYANGYIVDSISFPVQTADITYGRYPNGTGPFTFLSPTFAAENMPLGINEVEFSQFSIFPNPASGQVIILLPFSMEAGNATLSVFADDGKQVLTQNFISSSLKVNLYNLKPGLYLFRISDGKNTQIRKIVKN
jgi:hypothetical protein